MPLVTLRTDLTTLPYSLDRPGGDYSGQPYIKTPVPDITPTTSDPSEALFNAFQTANRETLDFPIRGGSITFNGLGGAASTPAGEIDRMRIRAFLDDKVRGTTFLLKQKGLELTNPNIPRRGINIDKGILPATRIYDDTGESLLAQVTTQGTGRQIQRFGTTPVYVTTDGDTYESYTRSTDTILDNRLLLLYQTKIAADNLISPYFIDDFYNVVRTGVGLVTGRVAEKYGISPNFTEIYNYEGGPGSTYGVGRTTIKRAVDTTQAGQKAALLNNTFTFTYQQLINQNTSTGTIFEQVPRQKISAKIQDFREQLNTATGLPANYLTANYNDVNKWYNPALRGNPGALETKRRISYKDVNEAKVDQINKIGLFHYNPKYESPFDFPNAKDIIKFGFECISNDWSDEAIGLVFRAYLTSFSDNHSAEYNNFKYLGRGETFRTYQGFDRSVSFSFKIAPQSRSEMISLYTKLNHLISQIYPDYSPKSKFMRSSIVKLTIGDYLYRMPGFIESINMTLLNEAAWEIALDPEGLDTDMNQLPQMIEVQCNFKPVHDFLPKRETLPTGQDALPGDPVRTVPFIGKRTVTRDANGKNSTMTSWIGTNKKGSEVASPAVYVNRLLTVEEQAYKAARAEDDELIDLTKKAEEDALAQAQASTTAQSQASANPPGTAVVKTKGKPLSVHSKACDDAASIIGSFANGTKLDYYEKTKSECSKTDKHDWYKVKGDGINSNNTTGTITGWVRGDFLTVTVTPDPATGTTTQTGKTLNDNTKLRDKPCVASGTIIMTVPKNTKIKATQTVDSSCNESQDWYYVTVTHNGVTNEGYMRSDVVKLDGPAPAKAAATATNASQTNLAAPGPSAATVVAGLGQQYFTVKDLASIRETIGPSNYPLTKITDFGIYEIRRQEPWPIDPTKQNYYLQNTQNSIAGWLLAPGMLVPFFDYFDNGGTYLAKDNLAYTDPTLTTSKKVIAGTKVQWINVSSTGLVGSSFTIVATLYVTDVPPTQLTNIAAKQETIYQLYTAFTTNYTKI